MKIKIIKFNNCKACEYYAGNAIFKNDNFTYTGKDKLYCQKIKKPNHFYGRYIGIKRGDCMFIPIPDWCPLEDYKNEVV